VRALAIAALAAAAFPAGARDPEPRPVIQQVLLHAPPGEDSAALQALLALKAGEPVSARAVRRTVQLLFQLGRFSNVVVRELAAPPAAPGGPPRVTLVVECLARRVVRSVVLRVAPPATLGQGDLRKAVGLAEGDELFSGRLHQAEEAVRALAARRGYREARVEATVAGEAAADVEIRVDEGQPTRVLSVAVGPQPGLPLDDLLAGMRTHPGAILDLDALDADVRDLRARLRKAQYYRARVGSPSLAYRGTEASISIPVEAGSRISFRFVGNTWFPDADLQARLGYDPELPLDAPAIEASAGRLKAFLQERGFYLAQVTAEEVARAGQLFVVFHLDEGRRYRLRSLRFQGQSFRDEEWLRARFLEDLAEQARPDLPRPRARLDALATAAGTPAAQSPLTPGPADPGEVYGDADWVGKDGQAGAAPRLTERYRQDGFLSAAVEVARIAVDTANGTIDVDVRVREGVRTLVESISFEGNAAIPLRDLARQATLAPGDPLSLARAEETRLALLDLYARRGFLYARIEGTEDFSPDRKSAALRYRVEEGPQVRVGSVFVTGNRLTREAFVRSTIDLEPGTVYTPEAASKSQAGLLRLGIFRSVGLRLSDPDVAEAEKDLTVEVVERAWQTLVAGLGFSLADGPRAFVEYGLPNLFGRAVGLDARLKANYPLEDFRPELKTRPVNYRVEGIAGLGLTYPRVFGLSFTGARLDLIAEHRIPVNYELARAAVSAGLDLSRFGPLGVSLNGDVEVDNLLSALSSASLFDVALPAEARLLYPLGITTLFSLRPVLTLDFRDNAAHPRRGWFANAVVEYVHSLGNPGNHVFFGLLPGSATYINMVKVSGGVTGYLPFASRSVLALALRGGQVFPIDSASQTIGPKRFYLGGASTMRGYGEDEMIPEDRRDLAVAQTRRCATSLSGLGCSAQLADRVNSGYMLPSEGGQAYALVKAEIRVPVAESLELGFFADFGNLWLDPRQLSLADLRLNVGFGVRVITPVGPAVLDIGFNASPDSRINEPVLAPHFSIGFF
jgi:outer membrane protein assembly factor BamA